MTLTTNYQYMGRSSMLSSHGGYGYYVLLYAKTDPDTTRGVHTVYLKMRLACNVASSFYNWYSAGYARVGDADALNWEMAYLPSKAWNSEALTEGGYTYPRWVDLAEGTAEVNAGYGTQISKTLTWGYEMLDANSGAWFPQNGIWVTGNADVILPAIPGATVPEVPASAVMGTAMKITLNPVNEAYKHTLTYTFGTKTGTIGENLTGTVNWTAPLSLAEAIPNARQGTLQIQCKTYSGSNQIGITQTVKMTLSVPDSLAPTVSATWSDNSGAMEKAGSPVQLVSRLAVEGDVTTQYGATVKSTSVTLNGKAYSGAALTEAGDLTLKLTVTDSRGLTGVWQETVTVLAYEAPAVRIDASRWSTGDAGGVADDMGEYAKVTVSGTISDVPGNVGTLTLTAGSFEENREISTKFAEVFYISAPSAASLKLSAVVQDDYLSAESSMTLSVGYATMDFLEGGKGIAFGTTATQEGFECAMPARFTGGITGPVPVDGAVYSISDDAQLDEVLDELLAGMPVGSRKVVRLSGANSTNPLGAGAHMATIDHLYQDYAVVSTGGYNSGGKYRRRTKRNGVWDDLEWENPPLLPDTEYRTTERYLGKPVYVKVIDFGSLPNNSTKSMAHGLTKTAVVSLSASSKDGRYYFPSASAAERVDLYINFANLVMTATGDWSSIEAYITVKYTKD